MRPAMEPLRHYELSNGLRFDTSVDPPALRFTKEIWAGVIETHDNAIIDAVLKFAAEEGITDAYILDRQFVKEALLEKMEREREKEHKRNAQKVEDMPQELKDHMKEFFNKISEEDTDAN